MSQEKFSELIGISFRELQNWETDRCRAGIENLHDLSEAAGIPMQVCVALNAGQPLFYSLYERRFAYSSAEMIDYPFDMLFKYRTATDDGIIIKPIVISSNRQIQSILSCHRDLYGAKKSLQKEVLKAAIIAAPDLNIIALDSWGHYVGHYICLPLSMDVYQEIKKCKVLENYLTSEKISNIISQNEGVFFLYSIFAATWNISHLLLINRAKYYAKLNEKENFLSAAWASTKESRMGCEKLGMKIASSFTIEKNQASLPANEIVPAIYETNMHTMVKQCENLKIIEPSVDRADNSKISCFMEKTSNYDPLIVDEKENIICPNPECTMYGKKGRGNIVSNGTYKTKTGFISKRFICKECSKSFCSRSNTLFYDLRSSEDKVLIALKLLVKGMSLRSVAEVLKVKLDTVRHWLKVAAEDSENINIILKKEMKVSQAQLDKLWDFTQKKALRKRAALCKTL
ncbi:MAG: hypothetical protein KKC46_13930 [Proteobacteria bacterium]|nr:hypothetical protein [Pseudomonadota bacterium]